MQVVIPYKPHPKQLEVHTSPARYKVLNWGRRTGKSTLAIHESLKRALIKPGRYWIISPTYKQVKNIYWRSLINQIPKQLIRKRNETELILELLNGSLIELKGADNPDSLRGAGIQGVILDEYAFFRPDVWEEIIRPMLLDSQGWAIFISTPNGFNHFYDLSLQAQTNERWAYYHATTYDNPYISPSDIEEEKKTIDPDTFAQEYLGEFKKMKGLVYPSFTRDKHVLKPSEIPLEGMRYIGVDFGYTNPLSVLYVLVDYDNNWFVYDELYERGLKTKQATDSVKRKMNDSYFTGVVGDSAAAQEISNWSDHGIYVEPVNKTQDSIRSGIQLIQNFLTIQPNNKPRLFVSANCPNLIWEFETYHYPDKREDRNAPDDPVKENDHAMDSLRYLFLTYSQPLRPQKIKPQREKVFDPITGRLLS